MNMTALFQLSAALLLATPAFADDLEDSFKLGYAKGKDAGYQEGFAAGQKAAVTVLFDKSTPARTIGKFFQDNPPPAGSIFKDHPDLFYSAMRDLSDNNYKSLVFQGDNFDTIIKPTDAATTIKLPTDGSVAIISEKSLNEIKDKLGTDFLKNNMTLNKFSAQ